MAQDDNFIIGGREPRKSGSQGSPRTNTFKGAPASQPVVKLDISMVARWALLSVWRRAWRLPILHSETCCVTSCVTSYLE